MKKIFYFTFISFLILAFQFSVSAQSTSSNINPENIKKDAEQIYYDTLSPFCPGRALADCPTEQAAALKDKIKLTLESGKSREEVYEGILKEYGEHLRATPKLSGLGTFAWVIPLAIVGIGLAIVISRINKSSDS